MPITFDEVTADVRPDDTRAPEAAAERRPAPDAAQRAAWCEWLDDELALRERRRERLCDE